MTKTRDKLTVLELEVEQIHYDYNNGRISKEVKEQALKEITKELKETKECLLKKN